VYPALKKDGIFIDSTCSYSEEEDEEIADWMSEQFSVGSFQLSVGSDWGIVEVETKQHKAYCYRFFPDKIKGEGFFIATFKKNEGENFYPYSTQLQSASKHE